MRVRHLSDKLACGQLVDENLSLFRAANEHLLCLKVGARSHDGQFLFGRTFKDRLACLIPPPRRQCRLLDVRAEDKARGRGLKRVRADEELFGFKGLQGGQCLRLPDADLSALTRSRSYQAVREP